MTGPGWSARMRIEAEAGSAPAAEPAYINNDSHKKTARGGVGFIERIVNLIPPG